MRGGMHLRPASTADLDGINRTIEAAVHTWDLPDRVKRLAMPSYRYDPVDLDQLTVVVACDASDEIKGVVAWEPADVAGALSVHGLYVQPDHQRLGLGSRLLEAARSAAADRGMTEIRVKAQGDARPFFERLGFATVEPQTAGGYRHLLVRQVADETTD